ncbi:MAG: hypothetical protein WCY88_11200 [Spongiibacteraceae bacterium]
MRNEHSTIDVKNLCSRKLWDILNLKQPQMLDSQQKRTIEQELIIRQHYLKELASLNQQVH